MQEAEAARTPEDQRLRLVIYIDNFNLRPFNRNRVMRELRAFIGQKLAKDDQLMLVTYDRELHIRRTFTSDPGQIASAMLDLEKISAQGVHADSERRDVLQRIQDSQSAAEAESLARTYAQSTYNDLSFSIDALKKMVDALAGMPGRKAVVYVSDGLQMIAGQDVFYAVQNKYSDNTTSLTQTLEFDTSRRFTELTAQANANRITFYTIDAAGLRVYESNTAENQGSPTAPGFAQLVDSVRIANLQSPLQVLAEKTGGVAIINTNVVTPQLERISHDFNTYYSLGYTPSHYGDGRYYKIDVKVKRKDLQVRHREGYRDKSTDSRMNDGTVAALNFPFEQNPLGISVEFGQARAREDGFYLVPVLVRIPIGKLVLVPREKSDDARVRLFIAALDSQRRHLGRAADAGADQHAEGGGGHGREQAVRLLGDPADAQRRAEGVRGRARRRRRPGLVRQPWSESRPLNDEPGMGGGMARWIDLFRSLGESLLEVWRAELDTLQDDFQRSGRHLGVALGSSAPPSSCCSGSPASCSSR